MTDATRINLQREWRWHRAAMHDALSYERFLSPVQRRIMAIFGMGAKLHLDRSVLIEAEIARRGGWVDEPLDDPSEPAA